MRLLALTTLTMIAFAANSLLNRAALAGGHIGPGEFAALRVTSGALVLWLIVVVQSGAGTIWRRPDWVGVGGLAAYLLGFSYAYLQLDAGLGALVLFAGVQLTMFAGALAEGEAPPVLRWLGMAVSLTGLVFLAWPGAGTPMPPFRNGALIVKCIEATEKQRNTHGISRDQGVGAAETSWIVAAPTPV
jgi:drug/metabolite transporter (DMT)-like permease